VLYIIGPSGAEIYSYRIEGSTQDGDGQPDVITRYFWTGYDEIDEVYAEHPLTEYSKFPF